MTVFPSLFTSKQATVAPHGKVYSGDKENLWQILKANKGEAISYLFYLFIYYFPTIKITQALHYTKMWRGDLRKPQGLYEEAPSLQ